MINSQKQLECFLGQFSGFYQKYLKALSIYFGSDREAVRFYFPYSPAAPASSTLVIGAPSPEELSEERSSRTASLRVSAAPEEAGSSPSPGRPAAPPSPRRPANPSSPKALLSRKDLKDRKNGMIPLPPEEL